MCARSPARPLVRPSFRPSVRPYVGTYVHTSICQSVWRATLSSLSTGGVVDGVCLVTRADASLSSHEATTRGKCQVARARVRTGTRARSVLCNGAASDPLPLPHELVRSA